MPHIVREFRSVWRVVTLKIRQVEQKEQNNLEYVWQVEQKIQSISFPFLYDFSVQFTLVELLSECSTELWLLWL